MNLMDLYYPPFTPPRHCESSSRDWKGTEMIRLTTEQAQQIEEALDELRYANNTDIAKTKYYKALAAIRTARAQEQAEQEPVHESLQIAAVALQDIACSSQTNNLLWWQIRAREAQKQIAERLTNSAPAELVKQEPVPTGATHYQPRQKTYYKRVSATEWYLWSCTGKGWFPSKGTSDSSEWIMLSPIQAHQPAKPAEQEPVISEVFRICDAYESGFGHGAKNDGLNDGSIFADKRQGEAYELGYAEGVKRSKREQAKQDLDTCPGCGGVADNGHDREFPPNPYYCTKCVEQAEQEPVAWYGKSKTGNILLSVNCVDEDWQPLYAAPVRTKDLTDGELEDAFKELGGKWNGDIWTIEDADLHPCLRNLIYKAYGG